MILGFMALAFFLPRPGNTRQIAEASNLFDQSQDAYETSEYGIGPDGKDDGNEGQSADSTTQGSGSGDAHNNTQGEQGRPTEQGNQGKQENQGNQGDQGDQGDQENQNGAQDTKDSGEQSQDKQSSDMSSGKQKDKQEDKQEGRGDENQQPGDSNNQSTEQNNPKTATSNQGNQGNQAKQPENENLSEQNKNNQQDNDSENTQQSSQYTPPPASTPELPSLGALGQLIQVLFWIIAGGFMLFYLMKNYRTLWKSLREMISGFLTWLSGIFAGTAPERLDTKEKPTEQPERTHPPFSSFRDPFASKSQMSIQELINYSFSALESLGQELGIERKEDQTPNEFSQTMAQHITPLGQSTLRLGNHYSLAAYAPALLNPNCIKDLQTFWQQLSIVEIRQSGPVNASFSD